MKDVPLLNEMVKMSKGRKTKQISKTPHFKWPQSSITQTKQVHWAKSAKTLFKKRLIGLWTLFIKKKKTWVGKDQELV